MTPSAVGTVTIKPDPINFGNKTEVGHTSKGKKVTIKNTDGKKSHISVQIFSEEVAPTPPFALKSTCEKTLAPGKSCKFQVTFTPTDTTPATGTLSVFDSTSGTAQVIPLTGTGKPPKQKK